MGVNWSYCVCSRLDPEGKYRHPDYGRVPSPQNGHKKRQCCHDGDTSIDKSYAVNGPKIKMRKENKLSKSHEGIVRKDDIEKFPYACLQNDSDLSLANGLKLPLIAQGRKRTMYVPDNTPIGKPIRKARTKRTSSTLPPIHKNGGSEKRCKSESGDMEHLSVYLENAALSDEDYIEDEDFEAWTREGPVGKSQHSTSIFSYKHSSLTGRGYCTCEEPVLGPQNPLVSQCRECLMHGGHHEWCSSGQGSGRAKLCLRCKGLVRNKVQREMSFDRRFASARTKASKKDIEEVKDRLGLSESDPQMSDSDSGSPRPQMKKKKKKKAKCHQDENGTKTLSKNRKKKSHVELKDLDDNTLAQLAEMGVLDSMGQYDGGLGLANLANLPENIDNPEVLDALHALDNKFEQGTFDFKPKVSINDVDTTLHLPEVKVEDQDEVAEKQYTKKMKMKKFNWDKTEIYPNGYREAYIKALAAAQLLKLPSNPSMLENRISRSYVFSYFDYSPREVEQCQGCMLPVQLQPLTAKEIMERAPTPMGKKKKKKKKFSEMQHIFGNININDYYPGGKFNPTIDDFRV